MWGRLRTFKGRLRLGEENIIIFFIIRVIKTFSVLPGGYVCVHIRCYQKAEYVVHVVLIYCTLSICSEIMIKINNMLYHVPYLPGRGNGNPFVIIAL